MPAGRPNVVLFYQILIVQEKNACMKYQKPRLFHLPHKYSYVGIRFSTFFFFFPNIKP